MQVFSYLTLKVLVEPVGPALHCPTPTFVGALGGWGVEGVVMLIRTVISHVKACRCESHL